VRLGAKAAYVKCWLVEPRDSSNARAVAFSQVFNEVLGLPKPQLDCIPSNVVRHLGVMSLDPVESDGSYEYDWLVIQISAISGESIGYARIPNPASMHQRMSDVEFSEYASEILSERVSIVLGLSPSP
jgi:hypothetical protein